LLWLVVGTASAVEQKAVESAAKPRESSKLLEETTKSTSSEPVKLDRLSVISQRTLPEPVKPVQLTQQPIQQQTVREPVPQQQQQQLPQSPAESPRQLEQFVQSQEPTANAPSDKLLLTSLPAEPCESRPGQSPEMVLIEAGRFIMGSPADEAGRNSDEGPQHEVSVVHPFALSRCEVSRGDFAAFVLETGYRTDAERGTGCVVFNSAGDKWEQQTGMSWRDPGFAQTDQHPVVCVSWRDAQAYAAWLSARTGQAYRLPSEAEWEYAARAETRTSRFWGDEPDTSCDYANGSDLSVKARFPAWSSTIIECDDRHVFTAPVGSYRRNRFGLSDMLGNVWEWVQDCYYEDYDKTVMDGSVQSMDARGDCTFGMVFRGGGWDNSPLSLRSANRDWFSSVIRFSNLGFRLARTL
jgi:formylglycine-generating enzyme required for sulfatase activity